MSKTTDIILSNPANRQAVQILSGVKNAYDNADLIGSERSAITGLHQLLLAGVDNLAERARSASTDLMETMLGISILEFCDFNTKMGIFMNRLMQININEKRITLNNLGRDAMDYGLSDSITGKVLRPSYANGMNYLDFVQNVRASEPSGVLATQHDNPVGNAQKTISPNKFDYGNLYPDDLEQGRGEFNSSKKWVWGENQNSILYKTKRLFEDHKINTIISRFGTQADDGSNHIYYNGSKRTVYGESHGRNLLKASAEKNASLDEYVLNGYNNPYCRVWTHHYQYNQFYKTIRPFSKVTLNKDNGKEEPSEEDTLSTFHRWKEFKYDRESGDNDKGYGWKNGDAGWDKSVLSLRKGGDGIVKITPKYVNSRETNIHTKECMFSIENLAWKGYDPYSFEKALSWEQRGPLGGRIMWFPPYGITFNETTNVNWSANTFIGRGEDVFTYVNTMRSGTLSFLMVVDHPSVIDYASWYDDDGTDPYEDTDLMRFFAGCDSLDPSDSRSILSRVRPTPLTDEYLAEYADDPGPVKENQPPPPKTDPVIPKETKKISFYVFYPNNYSGYYDDPNFAVAYLLAGAGCQKNGAEDLNTMEGSDGIMHEFTYANLNKDFFENYTNPGYETTVYPVSNTTGYETDSQGMMNDLDNKENFIYGFGKSYSTIPKTEKKRWYYRVDGKYASAKQTDTRNTYGQKIPDLDGNLTITPTNTNYCDNMSFHLNSSMTHWPDNFRSDDETLYCTFADIAAMVAKLKNMKNVEEFCEERSAYGNIIVEQMNPIFKNFKLISVDCVGYSNAHGFNKSSQVNASRNSNLAIARGNTIIQWLKKNEIIDDKVETNSTSQPSTAVAAEDKLDHSGRSAKLWRSAKVTLTFETDEEKELAKLKQAESEEENTVKFVKYTGYTPVERDGKIVYKGEDGKIWIEQEKEGGGHELVREDAGQLIGVSNNMRGATQKYGFGLQSGAPFDSKGNINMSTSVKMNAEERKYGARRDPVVDGDKNVYRYDQEYYFFRALKKKDPLVFNKLMDKIKYFDPAFHSMTPEGFNARLTFLNQCTRQGNTITMSDFGGKTANNLAFGRPPYCVLRIGDFYNQMIVIDNINIDYNVSNGIQWDMNTEGIGMQPLLAQINISFKFIGGGDIAGPIRRLQNAMSFNYYANTRFYDNRADRVKYLSDANWKEIGGAGNHEVDINSEQNYAYRTETYKKVKK